MPEILVPIVLFLAGAWMVVSVARIVADAALRRQALAAGLSPEQTHAALSSTAERPDHQGALKWGMVTVAVGAALILVQYLPYRGDDPIVYGIVLAFGGAGLLTYAFGPARRRQAAGQTPEPTS